jgi:hypothetical protein
MYPLNVSVATRLLMPVLLAGGACARGAEAPSASPAPRPAVAAAEITNAEQLVRAMRDRYEGKWYRTLTFVQNTANTQPDGTVKNQTWYESASLPGKLRIDFDPRSAGNGILFAEGTLYPMQNGQPGTSRHFIHPLLVLGFDVYAQPVKATISQLREIGIDLSKFHTGQWQGHPVYIVGADAGDEKTKQFWVEQDRLLFVRMLQPARDTTKANDTRFNSYQRAGNAWISPEVEFLTDGKRNTLENYRDIKADVALDPALFDPKQWSSAKHWAP